MFILKKLKVVVVWYLRGRRGDASTARFSSLGGGGAFLHQNLRQLRTGTPERPLQMMPKGPKFSGATRRETHHQISTHIQYRSTALFAAAVPLFLNPALFSRCVLLFYQISVCLSVCLSAEGMPTKRALHQPGLTQIRASSKEQVFVRHKSLPARPPP